MMNYYGKIKLAIIDDNKKSVEEISSFLESNEKYAVMGTAVDGRKAIKLLSEKAVDIVLINMLLPGISGLSVLDRIMSSTMREKPGFIMFITASTEYLTNKAFNLGARHFIYKPYDKNKMMEAIDKIYNLKNAHLQSFQAIIDSNNNASYEQPEQFVSTLLKASGFSPNLKGYLYLKEAVLMEIEERCHLGSMTKKIYPEIAKKYGTTPSCVERAMRHSIEKAWKISDGKEINKILGIAETNMKKPSNGQLIKTIVDIYDDLT